MLRVDSCLYTEHWGGSPQKPLCPGECTEPPGTGWVGSEKGVFWASWLKGASPLLGEPFAGAVRGPGLQPCPLRGASPPGSDCAPGGVGPGAAEPRWASEGSGLGGKGGLPAERPVSGPHAPVSSSQTGPPTPLSHIGFCIETTRRKGFFSSSSCRPRLSQKAPTVKSLCWRCHRGSCCWTGFRKGVGGGWRNHVLGQL